MIWHVYTQRTYILHKYTNTKMCLEVLRTCIEVDLPNNLVTKRPQSRISASYEYRNDDDYKYKFLTTTLRWYCAMNFHCRLKKLYVFTIVYMGRMGRPPSKSIITSQKAKKLEVGIVKKCPLKIKGLYMSHTLLLHNCYSFTRQYLSSIFLKRPWPRVIMMAMMERALGIVHNSGETDLADDILRRCNW